MNIYNGPYLNVLFEEENNRFINSWKTPPKNADSFKSELLEYLAALEKVNPTQIIWLQENFTYKIEDSTKLWVEQNILKPRFEAGFVKADKDNFHPIAFVVGQDVLTHMEVIGVFDEPSPSVFNPKHFATRDDAEAWLDKEFTFDPIEHKKTEIIYKGLGENGKAILEIRSPTNEITNTINTFKTILEENEFIKENVAKYSLLSKREIEVLKLIGKGEKHQKIADTLFISIHTVREHLKNTKQKLEVNSNPDLLKFYNAFLKK